MRQYTISQLISIGQSRRVIITTTRSSHPFSLTCIKKFQRNNRFSTSTQSTNTTTKQPQQQQQLQQQLHNKPIQTIKSSSSSSSSSEFNSFQQYYKSFIKTIQSKKKLIFSSSSLFLIYSSTCIYTRQWRDEHLDLVPLARTSNLFYVTPNNDDDDEEEEEQVHVPQHGNGGGGGGGGVAFNSSSPRRNLKVLSSIVERNGLMGRCKPGSISVKDELDAIRAWHQERGYRGGLVLRELTKPLYTTKTNYKYTKEQQQQQQQQQQDPPLPSIPSGDDVEITPDELPQRECYYLYYEIKPNGHTVHEIFCRGTTLLADVWTCLQFIFVWDDELECYLHGGFRNHAQRLVEDVEPLLVRADNSTVEVCG